MLLIICVCVCVGVCYLKNVHYFALQQLAGKFLSLALYLFTQPTLNSVLTLQMKIVLTSLTRYIVSFSTQLTYIQAHLCIGIDVNECICMHVFTEINVHTCIYIYLLIINGRRHAHTYTHAYTQPYLNTFILQTYR